MADIKSEFTKGIIKENPVLILMLGLCPTLAVTTSLDNALGMGGAATFVLICSNLMVSLFKSIIPKKVRIPCYIVIIATFVTVVDLVMNAYLPALHASLGLFIPLIVVNCVILGRAEAFASKNSPVKSVVDGIGMGVGFTLALCIMGTIREFLGTGQIWKTPVCHFFSNLDDATVKPAGVMTQAAGAFLVLGMLLALSQYFQKRKKSNG